MKNSLSSCENPILILVEWQCLAGVWPGSLLGSCGGFLSDVLAHDELLDLAARRAREVVGLMEFLGPLLPSDARGVEVRPHLVERRHRGIRAEPQNRGRPLAEALVGGGDDDCLE